MPDTTGRDLGSTSQRWDLYAQNLNVLSLSAVRLADQFSGADAGAQIAAAILDLPSTGGVVDARGLTGAQTCSANPFAGVTKTFQLLLGFATFTTDAQWKIPNKCQVIGSGRGDTGSAGTVIKASASFPTSTAVVRLGDGTTTVHGCRISNLSIDANGLSGSGCLYSTDANEQSGGEFLTLANGVAYGFKFDGSGSGTVAVNPAQNYCLRDIEIYPQTYGVAGTVGGIFIGNSDGPQDVRDITFVGNSAAKSTNAFTFDNVTIGAFTSMHVEQCTNGFNVGGTTACNGLSFNNLSGHSSVTTLVSLNSASTQNISLINLVKNGATNAVADNVRTQTDTSNVVALYVLGAGSPRSYLATSTGAGALNMPAIAMIGGLNLNSQALSGGTIDGVIGSVTPAAGTFTALSSTSGAVNGTIGATTPAAGTFTTASASTSLTLGAGTAITKIVVYTPTLTPASVNAATVAEQTFTVTGLTTADKVIVNPPSIANSTGVAGVRVSAADTLAIRFVNPTVGALTPTSGTYTVIAVRS